MPWIALKTVHSPMYPYQMLSSKLCIPQASRKCKSTRESDKREEGDIASRFVLSTHRLLSSVVAAMFPFPFRSRAIFVAMMITRSSVRSCAKKTTTRPSRSISVVTFFFQGRRDTRVSDDATCSSQLVCSMCARGFLFFFFVVFCHFYHFVWDVFFLPFAKCQFLYIFLYIFSFASKKKFACNERTNERTNERNKIKKERKKREREREQ